VAKFGSSAAMSSRVELSTKNGAHLGTPSQGVGGPKFNHF